MQNFRHVLVASTLLLPTLVGAESQPTFDPNRLDQLRLNQIQVIGSHNSYKVAFEPELYQMMLAKAPETESLDYAHPPLSDQLNLGLRNLELDVYYDPVGGRFAKPLGLAIVRQAGGDPLPYDPQQEMGQPGFKILHIQDLDFRSHCPTLAAALNEIRTWSEQHPRHLPVMITLNCKSNTIDLPGSTPPLPFDLAAFDALDEEILANLGKQKLILPDDVRGDAETLEAAVLASAWPKLASARGRFLLVLDETGPKQEKYLVDHPSLRGRVLFVNSQPGNPEAAVMIRNNPRAEAEEITRLVKLGYLVRTRADAGTKEARANDFSRFEAAQASGAQVISTDYYLADWRLNANFRIRFGRHRCSRLNPVTGPKVDHNNKALRLE